MAEFIFVKIDGVDGSSDDDKHKGWIPVSGYSSGVEMPMNDLNTGGHGASGRVNADSFTFTKLVDRSTPKLYEMCCDGQTISKVEVHHCRKMKGDNVPYWVYEMKDAIIASVKTSASGDELASEEVAINCAQIEWALTPTDVKGMKGGAIKAGFDFVKNKKN